MAGLEIAGLLGLESEEARGNVDEDKPARGSIRYSFRQLIMNSSTRNAG